LLPPGYCNQAAASDAAATPTTAQTPSEDKSTTKDKACLVRAMQWARCAAEMLCTGPSLVVGSVLESDGQCVKSKIRPASDGIDLNYISVNLPSIARQNAVHQIFLVGFDGILPQ